MDRAVVRTYQHGFHVVNDRALADICMQHLVAIMLIDGTVTFESSHDVKRMKDPKVLELRRRIEFYGDDKLERAYRSRIPSRQAIVDLKLRDGRTYTKAVRGTVQNPMNREEVGEKCFALLVPVLGKKRSRELIDAVWNIERVGNVRTMRRLLRA